MQKGWLMNMSIFRVITKADDGIDCLNEKLVYVVNFRATQFDLIGSVNVGIRNAYVEMLQVKKVFNESMDRRSATLNGKAFFHYVFSPEKDDSCSVETLIVIAKAVAKFLSEYGGEFQVVYAVHITDVETGEYLELPHVHFIGNNISFVDGRRFNLSKAILYDMREYINDICYRYGVSVIKNSIK